MPQETRPTKCIPPFPISHVNLNTAGVKELAPAPGNAQCYYVTGFYMTAATVSDGFSLLRRNCIELSETTDYLTVTSAAGIIPTTVDFSIIIFVKIPTTITTIPKIYHKDDGSNKGVIVALASGYPKITIGDGSDTSTVTSSYYISDGNWHMIAVTCDRNVATGLYIQVDGHTREATSGGANDVTAVGTIDNTTDLTIYGVATYDWYLGPVAYFDGADGLLTQAAVNLLWNKGIGVKFSGTETGLSWAINCDEGISTTSYDVLATSNAALSGAPLWPPFRASAATAKDDTCGPPFDNEVMGFVGEFASGAITTQGGIPSICMTFPEAIKIGRNNPLRILETNGQFDLILFGHPDGPS